MEKELTRLRTKVRKNASTLMKRFSVDYLEYRESRKGLVIKPYCIFCGTYDDLTKEHIIPKWVFQSNPNLTMTNTPNMQSKRYIDATLPACRDCNGIILGKLERYIETSLAKCDFSKVSNNPIDISQCIRWLEIINYKLHVMGVVYRFTAHKGSNFIPYLKDFPLSMLKRGGIGSFEVQVALRKAMNQIMLKDKTPKHNSILFANNNNVNTSFHFFQEDEFIFIQFPSNKKAMFMFFNKHFKSVDEMRPEMMQILEEQYHAGVRIKPEKKTK